VPITRTWATLFIDTLRVIGSYLSPGIDPLDLWLVTIDGEIASQLAS
jgi:hypothetical protein